MCNERLGEHPDSGKKKKLGKLLYGMFKGKVLFQFNFNLQFKKDHLNIEYDPF
jgi:hypothetical protein